MKYKPEWDLPSIPTQPFESERARRQRAKGPKATHVVLKQCRECGKGPFTSRQRRKCPNCGHDERSKKS